jgi:hypothetical protein
MRLVVQNYAEQRAVNLKAAFGAAGVVEETHCLSRRVAGWLRLGTGPLHA